MKYGSSLEVMVLADVDLLEHAESVFRQHGRRAVERDEVLRRAFRADAHLAHGEARRDLAGNAGLEETDDAALLFADAHQENVRLVVLRHGELVARDEREAPPREERRAEERLRRRRHAAARALPPERGDRARVRDEERRL